MTRYYY